MGAVRKLDLDHRLESYSATLRSSSLTDALKRRAGRWQLYAAVTGSAMAMATNASASIIGSGTRDIPAEPTPDFLASKQHLATSQNTPLIKAVRLAMARRNSGERFVKGAAPSIAQVSQAQTPVISAGGVFPLYSSGYIIQPGEWITIKGSNLASVNAVWNGDFPTSLGGTSVQIDGKAAYISLVTPGQINAQAPDDTATGVVSVVVTTSTSKATSTVTLNHFAPSFDLLDARHVSGIIVRSNGSGAYGHGTYDILGPTGNCYSAVPAQAGDTVELFGYGFGPTTPAVPAGKVFSGAAPIDNPFYLYINEVLLQPTFVGLSSAGVYQINVVIPPGLGKGDVPILAVVGSMQTQKSLLFSLQGGLAGISCNSAGTGGGGGGGGGGYGGGTGGEPGGGTGFGGTGFGGGGSGGGWGGGGSGGGWGSIRFPHKGKPYAPRLLFTPK